MTKKELINLLQHVSAYSGSLYGTEKVVDYRLDNIRPATPYERGFYMQAAILPIVLRYGKKNEYGFAGSTVLLWIHDETLYVAGECNNIGKAKIDNDNSRLYKKLYSLVSEIKKRF